MFQRTVINIIFSILKAKKFNCLREYLVVEDYKSKSKFNNYVSWNNIKNESCSSHQAEWFREMDKLVEMKLAVKMGKTYTTTHKVKEDWVRYAVQKGCEIALETDPLQESVFEINTYNLLKHKSKSAFKEHMYLTILGLFSQRNSLTRELISGITGLSKKGQYAIEEKVKDRLTIAPYYVPVNLDEIDKCDGSLKDSGIPTYHAYTSLDGNVKLVGREKDKLKGRVQSSGNSRVRRMGNIFKVDEKYRVSQSLLEEKSIGKKLRFKNKISRYRCDDVSGKSEATEVKSRLADDFLTNVNLLVIEEDERKDASFNCVYSSTDDVGYKKFNRWMKRDPGTNLYLSSTGRLLDFSGMMRSQAIKNHDRSICS